LVVLSMSLCALPSSLFSCTTLFRSAAIYPHKTHPLVVRKVFWHGLRVGIKVIARHIITEKQMANGSHMGVSVGVDGRYRKKSVGLLGVAEDLQNFRPMLL